jgi:hypothetical protein
MSTSVVAPVAVATITAPSAVVQTTTGVFVVFFSSLSPADLTTLADALQVAVDLGRFDGAVLQDFVANGLARPIEDLAGFVDVALLGFDKNETDFASLSDLTEKNVALAALENLFVQQSLVIDGIALTLLAAPSDLLTVSDSLVKLLQASPADLAGFADQHFIALELPQSDALIANENIAKSFEGFQQDLANLVDSGLLINQNYTDSNEYFAADFVGISISF